MLAFVLAHPRELEWASCMVMVESSDHGIMERQYQTSFGSIVVVFPAKCKSEVCVWLVRERNGIHASTVLSIIADTNHKQQTIVPDTCLSFLLQTLEQELHRTRAPNEQILCVSTRRQYPCPFPSAYSLLRLLRI